MLKNWNELPEYMRTDEVRPFENEITLPLYTKLTDEEVDYIIKEYSRIVREYV